MNELKTNDVNGKSIYRVVFGQVMKLTAISKTNAGYKAQTKSGVVWQIWEGKRYSGSENYQSIYYVEKCFFNAQSALKYAREQLKEMEAHYKYKSEDYFKRSGRITIEQ